MNLRAIARNLGARALSVLALVALILFAAPPARAQIPLPFFEHDEPEKRPAPKKEADRDDEDTAAQDETPRMYAKPSPKPLPEGPADVLEGPVILLRFKGMVNPGMGEYIAGSLERAQREHAQAVLIELDTPGGLVSTTETIVQAILGAKVPVIVYVTPSGAHAASAGTFITLAAHVAAMAPATRLGAAHPVTGSGKDPEEEGGKHLGKKVENDLVAFVEGIARERNRNVEWAIDAVKNSVSINADRALELGVIDVVARNRAELLDVIDGRQMMIGPSSSKDGAPRKVELRTKSAEVVEYKLSIREWVVNLLANPGIAMILGIIGLIGIMAEVYHPGLIVPGVMGVLSIICALIAMEQLPIDVGAAILVVAGIGLIIAELYAPTYGLLGVLGGIGLCIGLLLLVDTSDPSYLIDESIRLGLRDILPLIVLLLGFVAYLSFFVMKKRKTRPVTGSEGLIGSVGFVLKPVGPDGGTVFVLGEYWRAKAAETIPEKEEVEVVKVDGLELEVRRRPGRA